MRERGSAKNGTRPTDPATAKNAGTGKETNHPNVSDPIYTQNNGFYRYSYDNKQLEFINNQTKIVTARWNIPKDQWQSLPDKKDLCRKLTAEATAAAESDRLLTIRGISAAVSFAAAALSYLLLGEVLGWPNIPFYISIGVPILFWVIFYNIICKFLRNKLKK